MKLLTKVKTKARCTAPVRRFDEQSRSYQVQECGFEVQKVVEGTERVRCLSCMSPVIIPEAKKC